MKKNEIHQNEPEIDHHEGPGMPPGGDNTTASEFQDIEHQPGPKIEAPPDPKGEITRKPKSRERQMQTAVVTCCMPEIGIRLPSVESTGKVTVCRNEEKGWHIKAATDIPGGTMIAIYPLTVKMQPSWSHKGHTTQDIATQTQYLMPIYASNAQTGRDHIVKNLVGDVSTDAPIEHGGIPCVAHLVNEAVKANQVNVCYVYTIEETLAVGTERRYGLWTTQSVQAGHELLADYGRSYRRTWEGLHQRRKRHKEKHASTVGVQASAYEGPHQRARASAESEGPKLGGSEKIPKCESHDTRR